MAFTKLLLLRLAHILSRVSPHRNPQDRQASRIALSALKASHALVPNPVSFPRRIYDAIICLLDSKHAPLNETRKILERGMRSGAVSMLQDVSCTLLFLYLSVMLPPRTYGDPVRPWKLLAVRSPPQGVMKERLIALPLGRFYAFHP